MKEIFVDALNTDNAEILTLYKLMILYMLSKVDYTLTWKQIMNYILEKEYTNYFVLQSVLHELIDDGMIELRMERNRSNIRITSNGMTTFLLLKNDLGISIKKDIDTYFEENNIRLRNETSVSDNCFKNTSGEYVAELAVREGNTEELKITLAFPNEQLASSVCDNWRKKNQIIYEFLMEQLL